MWINHFSSASLSVNGNCGEQSLNFKLTSSLLIELPIVTDLIPTLDGPLYILRGYRF